MLAAIIIYSSKKKRNVFVCPEVTFQWTGEAGLFSGLTTAATSWRHLLEAATEPFRDLGERFPMARNNFNGFGRGGHKSVFHGSMKC
jgi:hypothetical protein